MKKKVVNKTGEMSFAIAREGKLIKRKEGW
jgi:hypothetical protein